jgi:hypothetical protein
MQAKHKNISEGAIFFTLCARKAFLCGATLLKVLRLVGGAACCGRSVAALAMRRASDGTGGEGLPFTGLDAGAALQRSYAPEACLATWRQLVFIGVFALRSYCPAASLKVLRYVCYTFFNPCFSKNHQICIAGLTDNFRRLSAQ